MNRLALQQLAEDRLLDASTLLDAKRWSGAYYLAGYAVECGLKACIAKLTNQHDFPDKKLTEKSYTHDLEKLLAAAGLEKFLETDVKQDTALGKNWRIVKDWNEQARYQQWTEFQARQLHAAVTDSPNGVFQWIRGRW